MSEAPLDPAVDAVPAQAEAEPAAPTPADMPAHRPEGEHEDTEEQRLEHVRKMRSENNKLRAKLKELEPLAKKAQEADEAAKSKEQKAEERAAAAEAREREILERYTRMEVAVQYGLPPDDIEFIGSGTREEMDARAKRIAAKNAAAIKAERPPTDRPVEGLRPGATPEPPKPADDSYPESWTPPWVRGGDKESSIFHGQ